jgi:hypothetical protein
MATKKVLAQSIASFLRRNAIDPNAENVVYDSLDKLTYKKTGEALSVKDKVEILTLAECELKKRPERAYRYVTEERGVAKIDNILESMKVAYTK